MSTECSKYREIRQRFDVSRSTLRAVQVERAAHMDEVRATRRRYHDDIMRASRDETFQTVSFDGTDSTTCRVPYEWAKQVRNEAVQGNYVQQKIQTVLMHGVGLHFHVIQPYMEQGGNATVETLLHSLSFLSKKVKEVRLQFDGKIPLIT